MRSRLIRIAIASVFGLLLAAGIARWQIDGSGDSAAPHAVVSGAPQVGGPFTLTDHTGRTVRDADFDGRYRLIYFGFTNCPDICPTDLQVMAQALDRLGEHAARIQPLFITVDPERDTPERLAGYVKSFHPALIGLTGTAEQIREVARAYKVHHAKAGEGHADHYGVEHSAYAYLMGPDGRFLELFGHGTDAETMAAGIRNHLEG